MFRQRLFTTLILIPLVLLGIYYANFGLFTALILLLLLASAWEWSYLIPLKSFMGRVVFCMSVCITLYGCWCILNYWLFFGLFLWLCILLAVLTFPASQRLWGYSWVVALAGLILLPLFTVTLVIIYQTSTVGKDLFLYTLCLVWAADIGAYLVGKIGGRHKLIPQVSPGKTVEGSAGGFVLAMLIALIGYLYFQPVYGGIWFFTAVMVVLISMLGDLFISVLKRRCKIKDTGCIFPGHGGVLDRLDSLIAALPLFYCGLHFLPPGI